MTCTQIPFFREHLCSAALKTSLRVQFLDLNTWLFPLSFCPCPSGHKWPLCVLGLLCEASCCPCCLEDCLWLWSPASCPRPAQGALLHDYQVGSPEIRGPDHKCVSARWDELGLPFCSTCFPSFNSPPPFGIPTTGVFKPFDLIHSLTSFHLFPFLFFRLNIFY